MARSDRNDGAALRRELVRCATLALSSHNTRCWKFAIGDKRITIAPVAHRTHAPDEAVRSELVKRLRALQ